MNSLKISSALRQSRLILKTRRTAMAVVAACAMIAATIFFQQFDFTKKTAAAALRQDNPNSQDGLWVRTDEGQIQLRQQQPQLQPGTFRVFRLNQELLKDKLRTAPMES